MELTATFMSLLEVFRPIFTAPSFATFQLLMTGWILSVRHRYVTDLIVSSDSVHNGHFCDYHRFFSQAKWNIDQLWKHLARMLVAHFVGPDGVILLAGDDTLCRKRGQELFGVGMHAGTLDQATEEASQASLYTGESVLRYLPENIDMIGAVHPNGAMYEPAPTNQTGRGRRRKKGQRLSTRDQWAADRTAYTAMRFDQYGLHGTFETKTRNGLYYKAGKDRLLKFVLSRDVHGKRPTQIYYCTNLDMDVREILAAYSNRWSIEVTHHDAKQLLGLEDPANRVPLAVERTAPMSMFLYSLTVLWYAEHGHADLQFPVRPWYTRKTEPSFADMLTTLRRVTWEEQLSPVRPKTTVPEESIHLLTYLATLAG